MGEVTSDVFGPYWWWPRNYKLLTKFAWCTARVMIFSGVFCGSAAVTAAEAACTSIIIWQTRDLMYWYLWSGATWASCNVKHEEKRRSPAKRQLSSYISTLLLSFSLSHMKTMNQKVPKLYLCRFSVSKAQSVMSVWRFLCLLTPLMAAGWWWGYICFVARLWELTLWWG